MGKPYDPSIDYHCHILPGVDHGCDSMETCAGQLDYAKKAGIKTIISTSHFYPQNERVEVFLERRNEASEKVLPLIQERDMHLILCAETLWCPGIEKMEGLDSLIAKDGGFNHLLLELPFLEFDIEKVRRTLRVTHEKYGCDIILAHVERYSVKDILQFDYDYVKYQINARSFHRLSTKMKVNTYIKSGKVMACGSDIHGLNNTYRYF